MSEILDRVALVLAEEHAKRSDWVFADDRWFDVAKEVFKAMRDPPDKMKMAGAVVGPDTNMGEFDVDNACLVYQAMIDEALRED